MMSVSPNKVYLEKGVIVVEVVGDQTEESVNEMGEAAKKLADNRRSKKLPVVVLDDVRKLGKADTTARKAVAHYAKTVDYDRLAMLGSSNAAMRIGTNFMITAFGMGDKVKYFSNYDEALGWLGG